MGPRPAGRLQAHARLLIVLMGSALAAWAAWTWLPQRWPAACAVLAVVPGMDGVLADRFISEGNRLLVPYRTGAQQSSIRFDDLEARLSSRRTTAAGGAHEQERAARRATVSALVAAGSRLCAGRWNPDPVWDRRRAEIYTLWVDANFAFERL